MDRNNRFAVRAINDRPYDKVSGFPMGHNQDIRRCKIGKTVL